MTLPAQDIVERLRKAMDGVTPGPWFEGDKWVFVPPLDPENNASSALRNILRDVPEDELQANCAYIALCSPDNIGALLDTISRLTADNEALRKEVAYIRSVAGESRVTLIDQINSAESRVTALEAEVGRLREVLVKAKDVLGDLLRCEYESKGRWGITDCIDNRGEHYQSADLDKRIRAAEEAVPLIDAALANEEAGQ